MEQKLRFLLDRTTPFNPEKAKVLDDLTFAIKNNTTHVLLIISRTRKLIRFGNYLRKITIFGIMLTRF